MEYDLSKTSKENNFVIQEQNSPSKKKITPPLQGLSSEKDLEVKGPFFSDGNYEDLEFFKRKIIVPKQGSVKTYYYLQNISKKNIEILSIKSNDTSSKIKVEDFKGTIKPNQKVKVNLTIYDKATSDFSTFLKNDSRFNIISQDKTRVAKNYLPSQINYPDEKKSTNSFDIQTSNFTKTIDVIYDYSDKQKEIDILVQNYSKRITPKGYRVPANFSVYEYDEFITEFEKLNCFGRPFLMLLDELKKGTAWSPKKLSSKITSTGGSFRLQGFSDCYKNYETLYNQYYNERFPDGIPIEDRQEFYQKIKTLNDKVREIEKEYEKTKFTDLTRREELNDREKSLNRQAEDLYYEYGYDSRSQFDKFMDSGWGHIVQLGAFAVIAIAGLYTGGASWTILADVILNAGLGTYYLSRGNTRESLIWFLFLGMGRLHKLYNNIFNRIRRIIPGVNLEGISKSIAKKLEGISITTKEEMKAFLYTKLTKNERIVFKAMLEELKNKKVVEESLENLAVEIGKAKNTWRDIPWHSAMKLGPKALKLGRNISIDLAITFPLVQTLYDGLKKEFSKLGVDITWGERDSKLLNQLSERQSKTNIENLFDKIKSVKNILNEPEQAFYAEQLNKIDNVKQLEEYINMTKSDVEKKANEIKSKLHEESLKNPQLTKKYFSVGSIENIEIWEKFYSKYGVTGYYEFNNKKQYLNDEELLSLLKDKKYEKNSSIDYWGKNKEILKILFESDEWVENTETTKSTSDLKPKKP